MHVTCITIASFLLLFLPSTFATLNGHVSLPPIHQLASLPNVALEQILLQLPFEHSRDILKSLNINALNPLVFHDPKLDSQAALKHVIDTNDVQGLQVLLSHPYVDLNANDHYALKQACMNGRVYILDMLLKDPRIDPSVVENLALVLAAQEGQEQIVQRLLQDPRVNPSGDNNNAIKAAAYFNHLPIVALLLRNSRLVVDEWLRFSLFQIALEKETPELLSTLLHTESMSVIDPSDGDNFLIMDAVKEGKSTFVRELLKDVRVSQGQSEFLLACYNGDLDGMDTYLSNPLFTPGKSQQLAIRIAAATPHVHVMQTLLKDPRVDPRVFDSGIFRTACYVGHLPMVQLLMQDSRVSLMGIGNAAFVMAASRSHYEVVRELLKSNRLTPATLGSVGPLETAVKNKDVAMVSLLLADPRVHPSAINHKALKIAVHYGDVEIVTLFLSHSRIHLSEQDKRTFMEGALSRHEFLQKSSVSE